MEDKPPQLKSTEKPPDLVVKQGESGVAKSPKPEVKQAGPGNEKTKEPEVIQGEPASDGKAPESEAREANLSSVQKKHENSANSNTNQRKLTESQTQRIRAILEQLDSVRAALGNIDSALGSFGYGPDEAEVSLKSEWLPQALHILSKYLDLDHVFALLELANEHVMRPVLKPTYDLMESFKQAPAKEDWVARYRKKLSRISQLILSWEEEIIADPVAFIDHQRAFSLTNKTELNFPIRAVVCCLAILCIFVLVMLPPVVKFASGFTNPHVLLGAFVLLCGFALATLFLRRKEFWIGLFVTVAVGLLPFFCLPKPASEQPKLETPKPTQPKPEKPRSEQPKPGMPKSEQPKSAQLKPEQPKPEQPKPEQPKPEQPKSGQLKPEQPKPAQPKPEHPKSEQPKSEQPKPGQPKPE